MPSGFGGGGGPTIAGAGIVPTPMTSFRVEKPIDTSSHTERVTQVVQQTLEGYSNPTNLRATQVVLQTLEGYTNRTNLRATQVVIQVLRSVADLPPGNSGGHGGGGNGHGNGGGGGGNGHGGGGGGGGQSGEDVSYLFNQRVFHTRQTRTMRRKEGRFLTDRPPIAPPSAAGIRDDNPFLCHVGRLMGHM